MTIKTTSQGSSPLPTRALVLVKRMGQMLTKQNDWETHLPFKPSASARPRQTPQAKKILSNLLGCSTQRGWGWSMKRSNIASGKVSAPVHSHFFFLLHCGVVQWMGS